jgi:hypothetical protein
MPPRKLIMPAIFLSWARAAINVTPVGVKLLSARQGLGGLFLDASIWVSSAK